MVGFDAFISYSHAADGRLAPQLQAGLQRFAKPWWRRRALHVFRDETGLSANPHLWSAIEEALAQSRWLVILASPEAAASKWVGREIDWWLHHRSADHILIAVTDGNLVWDDTTETLNAELSTAIPPSLIAVFTSEPRWVDLRWALAEPQLDLRATQFRDAIADVAAPVHGVAKDELSSEEVRQHRRTVRTAITAGALMSALAIGTTIAGATAINQRNSARNNAQVSQARAIAAHAVANAPVSVDRSLLLGVHAVSLVDDAGTRRGLLTALDSAGSLIGFRPEVGGVAALAISDDGSEASTVTTAGTIRRWSTDTWELLAEGTTDGLQNPWLTTYRGLDELVAVYGDNGARLFDRETLNVASPVLGIESAGSTHVVVTSIDPSGAWFVASAIGDTHLVVGRTSDGLEQWRFEPECPLPFGGLFENAITETGLLLITCGGPGGLIYEIDFDDLVAPSLLATLDGLWVGAAFSHSGKMAVFTDVSGRGLVIDPLTGEELLWLEMPSQRAYAIVFDQSDRFLAIGGDNGTTRVWDLVGQLGSGVETVGDITGLEEGVSGVGFTTSLTEDFGPDPGPVRVLQLVLGSPSGLSEWDLGQRSVIGEEILDPPLGLLVIDQRLGLVYRFEDRLEPGGAGSIGKISAISLADGSVIREFSVEGPWILDADLSPDGTSLLLSTSSYDPIDERSSHPDAGPNLILVVSTSDGSVTKEIRTDLDPTLLISEATWSPNASHLWFTRNNGTAGVIDNASGDQKDFPPDEPLFKTIWAPNGQLVMLGYTGALTFFNPEDLTIAATLDLTPGFTLVDAEAAPNGRLLVTSESGEVWLVDPDTHITVGEPYRWGGTQLQQGTISDDGAIVAALSRDGTLRLWDGPTRLPLADALHAYSSSSPFDQMAFLSDGQLVTAANFDGSLLRWSFATDDLVERACQLVGRELTAEEWRMFVDPDGVPVSACD